MTPATIVDVFHRSPSLAQPQMDALLQAGVPNLALGRDPGGYAGFTLATDRIIFNARHFDFARDLDDPAEAVTALLIAARDESGDVVDIVAARPCDGRIATWLGRVGILGLQNIFAPRLECEALAVHLDALAWLRDDRRGVVIVNSTRAKSELADAGPFRATSIAHGRALRDALAFNPEIFVPAEIARQVA
jgi:hypothetical protein